MRQIVFNRWRQRLGNLIAALQRRPIQVSVIHSVIEKTLAERLFYNNKTEEYGVNKYVYSILRAVLNDNQISLNNHLEIKLERYYYESLANTFESEVRDRLSKLSQSVVCTEQGYEEILEKVRLVHQEQQNIGSYLLKLRKKLLPHCNLTHVELFQGFATDEQKFWVEAYLKVMRAYNQINRRLLTIYKIWPQLNNTFRLDDRCYVFQKHLKICLKVMITDGECLQAMGIFKLNKQGIYVEQSSSIQTDALDPEEAALAERLKSL